MTQTTSEFLSEKSRQATRNGEVDWPQRRDEYLGAVEALYGQIRLWLAEPLRQETAALAEQPRTLAERLIGSYEVRDLILRVADEEVIFSPVGRNVVGAAGRVEVDGEGGRETLLLMPGQRWSLLVTRQPTLRIEPLDERQFGELLRRVMRP